MKRLLSVLFWAGVVIGCLAIPSGAMMSAAAFAPIAGLFFISGVVIVLLIVVNVVRNGRIASGYGQDEFDRTQQDDPQPEPTRRASREEWERQRKAARAYAWEQARIEIDDPNGRDWGEERKDRPFIIALRRH